MKVPIKDLILRNPDLADAKQKTIHYFKVLNSLKKNGQINPLICIKEKDKYRVWVGNNRLLAGRTLGIKELDIIVVPNENNKRRRELMSSYQETDVDVELNEPIRLRVPADKVYLRNTQLEANPYNHKQTTIYKTVLNSLSKTPQVNPILVVKDGDKYKVVFGNNRYLAGKELGFKEFYIEVISDEEVSTILDAAQEYKLINMEEEEKIIENKTMIVLLDNFITLNECKQLVELYDKHKHLASHWLGSYPINTSDISHSLIKKVLKQSENVVQKYFNSKFVIEWSEIKWHTQGSNHPFHYDSARTTTTLASVTYLNDTSSGQTIFKDGLQVMPKIGRMIIFNGKEYLHGVNKCLEDRYTMPIWYKHS